MSALVFNKVFLRAATSARRLTTASRGARSLVFSNGVAQRNSLSVPRFNAGGINAAVSPSSNAFSTDAGAEEPAPGDGNLTLAFGQSLINMLPHSIYEAQCVNEELTLIIDPSSVLEVLLFLRDHTNCQYKCMTSLCAVDYPERDARFEMVYNLLSVKYNTRIRVKTSVAELQPVDSATELFSAAGWYEREVFDLFGIFFNNHSDLRRILTDYGFDGHPMRKDFPLTGYDSAEYDEKEKAIVMRPLELAQEFRTFDFASPWDQMTPATPDIVHIEAKEDKE
jgi:NADH dehydrogenase (ubiquinone) Fe-S protein 3